MQDPGQILAYVAGVGVQSRCGDLRVQIDSIFAQPMPHSHVIASATLKDRWRCDSSGGGGLNSTPAAQFQ